METKGIVVQVYDHSFDVMVMNCGVISRVYLDQLPLKQFTFETKHGKNQLTLEWNDSTDPSQDNTQQIIIACLSLEIQVSVNRDDLTKLNTILRHPNGSFVQKPMPQ
ncbi:unnamed protein product [Oppiella nova]|uniref:DIS3L2 C-terminal domain-containing protein n=1 Tax=Oppiella nova TaxID=334625 RepID=A0A7R9MP23_9ACAR|nr:unnamed protein product [Oppiella nova]CAG2180952.1 unnamed protein product [Oppiella nova]